MRRMLRGAEWKGLLPYTAPVTFRRFVVKLFAQGRLHHNLLIGLIDNLGALILPSLVTPFGVFLLRQFFVSVPREIEEAAWIDGCSRLAILVKVVLPLARPALATVAVLTLLVVWNDLTWPLIAINSDTNYTVQLGLATYQGAHRTEWSAVMAGNVLVTLPIVLAFLFAQRTFIRSLTSTAVKG